MLALKVCDPAMGSGAFLVEACRQLAARLVDAWARHPGARPALPADEDEELLARRLVAQRCLYGVDRNPMATDLARLSLWLATLARDHEFTFLDHALRTGDSLVGLTRDQVSRLDWREAAQGTLFGGLVRGRLEAAVAVRAEIRAAGDDALLFEQESRLAIAERHLGELRLAGDAVIAAHFGAETDRARGQAIERIHDTATVTPALWAALREAAATLATGEHTLRPFHWELEFPEVFAGAEAGFDAIVGNPPFAGKNTLLAGNRPGYLPWLQVLHAGAHGNADLVAHFFRRAFLLLKPGGCLGLIATNTVGQGDTRESGLRWLLAHGGTVLRATRRLAWPGEAAVVVSVVHVLRGALPEGVLPALDGRPARRVSAYLVEGELDASPARLAANAGKAFQGCNILGPGFTFDDEAVARGKPASPVAEMHRLIAEDGRNAKRIFPYLGSDEVNSHPQQAHRRWVIDFSDFPLGRRKLQQRWADMTARQRAACRATGLVPEDYPEPVAEDWPGLLKIVRRLVKPEREILSEPRRRDIWWQFFRSAPAMRQAVKELSSFFTTGAAMVTHHAIGNVQGGTVPSHKLIVFSSQDYMVFCQLQSSIHELWSATFGTTAGSSDAITYNPSQVFQTFPFVLNFHSELLTEAGSAYHIHRATLMQATGRGLTKTLGDFHKAAVRTPAIQELRRLHHALDQAVLRAYGWDDLAVRAAPVYLTELDEPEYRYQDRLFWPAAFRDEVLARLLALNASRAAEEAAAGLAPPPPVDDTDVDTLAEADA